MSAFKINKQTEAEKDEFLVDCFHDSGFIERLLGENYSIITGRKGSGKTAIARYLEKKASSYGIDFSYRISIRDVFTVHEKPDSGTIVFFIIVKTVQYLIKQEFFSKEARNYWQGFMTQNGLQSISDYQTFIESKKTHSSGFSIKATINNFICGADSGLSSSNDTDYTKATISNSPSALIESLYQSLPKDKKVYIFVDDLSDYLDERNKDTIADDINVIKDILFQFTAFNASLNDSEIDCHFIALLRDDLFEFMDGSNINKLRSDSLLLEWDEKSFAGLVIKRLPFYQDNLSKYLSDPVKSLREQFPDNIFADALASFNTNRYATNFYAYIVAISFNRPRDFLMFCYAMRERLSSKHPATLENIESTEIEYSDYFMKELRDELYLASKILKFEADYDGLNKLVDILSRNDNFKTTQLRTELSQYLGEKTSLGRDKIEQFIYQLWWYGLLGFRKQDVKGLINYRYISSSIVLTIERIKEYVFSLHRGLWWFAKKRKDKN
ncbi:MAG: hypothetical protein ABIG91_00300 [Patescibacteria group bacterium]